MTPVKGSAVVDTGVIYCGDNLEKLQSLPSGCIDLAYIDPPWNSNRQYEVFWGESREKRSFEDRHASTQAYIDFMRPRCLEIARVLKKTGSFYYHCDWHASHYIKIMLDQIFGEQNFVNEIIWKRQSAHNDAKQGSKHLGRVHDTLFLYANGRDYTFNHQYRSYDPTYIRKNYKHTDASGRRYSLGDITAPGGAAEAKGNPFYEFLGVKRYWRFSQQEMQRLYEAGEVVQSKPGAVPRQKRYLDTGKGVPIGTIWDDIGPVQSSAEEAVGYPTQKPLALLKRLIELSSHRDDIVLDAFCGCGTAISAAEQLKRQWIGIDVSPTACRVMAKRLRTECGLQEDERLWKAGRGFIVRDLPWSEDKLRKIPPFEFENWAVIALGGIPNKTQVGDMCIDGRIFPAAAVCGKKKMAKAQLDFMDEWYPVQVKQKDKVGRPDIDQFEAMMVREDRPKGFYVSFDYSSDAMREIDSFFRKTGKVIIPLTVDEILNEHLAKKLA